MNFQPTTPWLKVKMKEIKKRNCVGSFHVRHVFLVTVVHFHFSFGKPWNLMHCSAAHICKFEYLPAASTFPTMILFAGKFSYLFFCCREARMIRPEGIVSRLSVCECRGHNGKTEDIQTVIVCISETHVIWSWCKHYCGVSGVCVCHVSVLYLWA